CRPPSLCRLARTLLSVMKADCYAPSALTQSPDGHSESGLPASFLMPSGPADADMALHASMQPISSPSGAFIAKKTTQPPGSGCVAKKAVKLKNPHVILAGSL